MIYNQISEGYDIISINSGSVFHNDRIADAVNFNGLQYTPKYNEDAYVVKRDWRKLSIVEEKTLRPTSKCNDYNTVYLGDIPDALKICFEPLELEGSKNRDEVLQKFSNDAQKIKELSAKLNSFLLNYANKKP